jgi:hypothetical protein
MNAAGLTHSQVAVMLIDGALAHIAGNIQGKMPIEPVSRSTDIERASVGLEAGRSNAVCIAVGGSRRVHRSERPVWRPCGLLARTSIAALERV